jgi:hypothetical protein
MLLVTALHRSSVDALRNHQRIRYVIDIHTGLNYNYLQ